MGYRQVNSGLSNNLPSNSSMVRRGSRGPPGANPPSGFHGQRAPAAQGLLLSLPHPPHHTGSQTSPCLPHCTLHAIPNPLRRWSTGPAQAGRMGPRTPPAHHPPAVGPLHVHHLAACSPTSNPRLVQQASLRFPQKPGLSRDLELPGRAPGSHASNWLLVSFLELLSFPPTSSGFGSRPLQRPGNF